MRRYPSSNVAYSLGPGPLPWAIKVLIWSNVAAYVIAVFVPAITFYLGLRPAAVLQQYWLWQPITYMFLHGSLTHILFNMLALWMFGTELERMWGTREFLKYYLLTGLGAAATTIVLAIAPSALSIDLYGSITIGASGAIYGLLLAYGLYFPNRPIYLYFIFPIPAKYFVMIVGAIALLSSVGASPGGVAHAAHLGGLVAGYLYLKSGRVGPFGEIKYRYLKWKINRGRKKFDVYSGGRAGDRNHRVH